jgi:two-component system cell cycle sensor histidine kinase/response regulator CckA
VQRAAALTRQLLLFSRREVFQPRDLDLSESITNTVKMLRRILGENVQMQLKLASQPMFIHADAGMMDQVLLNLAVNARDAMPNGGQLVIETSGVEFDEFAASQSAQGASRVHLCA